TGVGWFTAILPAPREVGFAPGAGKLLLTVAAPEGLELSAGSPWSASMEVSRRSDLLRVAPEFTRGEARGGRSQQIELPVEAQHLHDVDSELLVELRAVACTAPAGSAAATWRCRSSSTRNWIPSPSATTPGSRRPWTSARRRSRRPCSAPTCAPATWTTSTSSP